MPQVAPELIRVRVTTRFLGQVGDVGNRVARHLALPGDAIEAHVDGDTLEPGRESRPRLPLGRDAPYAKEDFLRDVVGLVVSTLHASGEGTDPVAVALEEQRERGVIASPSEKHQRFI